MGSSCVTHPSGKKRDPDSTPLGLLCRIYPYRNGIGRNFRKFEKEVSLFYTGTDNY